MPYNGQHKLNCKACGRERRADEVLSARAKCAECSRGRMVGNIMAMVDHSGPGFLAWRRRVAASVGAILFEDLESEREERAA